MEAKEVVSDITEKFMRKISRTIVFSVVTLGIIYASIPLLRGNVNLDPFLKALYAATSFNTDPLDLATMRVSNYSQFPDTTTNWHTSVSANPGEVVSFAVYYHNTGTETATNVKIQMSVSPGASASVTGSGSVVADNAQGASGSATVNLSASESLTYIPGSARWYPDQSQTPAPFPFGQTGDEVVTTGVNVGDIVSGWPTQGSVVARFQVSQTGTPPATQIPTIDLKANNSDGPVTLSSGEAITLSWSSTNATFCNFGAPINSGVGTSGQSSFSADHPFYPKTPAGVTYTITCDNNGSNAVSDSVTVFPPIAATSSLDITANGSQGPLQLTSGQSFTVDWTSTNLASCTLSVPNIQFSSGVPVVGSSGVIVPNNQLYPATSSSNTFVINCSDVNSQNLTDSVVVLGPTTGGGGGGTTTPSVSLTANPTSITSGQSSTLTWISANTTDCSATWTSSTSTAGSQVVSPASTTTYLITCTDAQQQQASASATVTVTTGGGGGGGGGGTTTPSVSLTANPGTIAQGATSTLSWVGTNVTSCSAVWTASTSTTGSEIVSPATTTTFDISCTGSNGNASSSATVTVTTGGGGGGGGGGTTTPSVSLTANPGTITQGQNSVLSWTSSNVSSCSAPWTAATSTSGSETVAPTTTTTYDISCSGSNGSATSSVILTVNPAGAGGGGGGGGGGGSSGGGGGSSSGTISSRRRTPPTGGEVLGTVASCEYLKNYLRIGWQNDPVEVIKLQIFLKELEGFRDLPVSTVFDQATFDAVSAFQLRYYDDILKPWGYAPGESTGFVYILTKKKVNEIFCDKAFPLNTAQEEEIAQFKAFLESLKGQGITIPGVSQNDTPTTTGPIGGIKDITPDLSDTGDQGGLIGNERMRNIAAAVFAGPQGLSQTIGSIIVFLLILLAIYLVAHYAVKYQERTAPLPLSVARTRKMLLGIAGLILAVILTIVFKFYVIVLPLLVLLIILAATLLWDSLKKSPIPTQQAIIIPPSSTTSTTKETPTPKTIS